MRGSAAYGDRVTSPGAADGVVDVQLLGPVTVRLGGRPVQLGGARPRGLLAILALNAGTTVSVERLIESLWDGDPPRAASNTIQVYVSRLRRALTPEAGRTLLQGGGGGYVLQVRPDAVDALCFERLAADGARRLAAGDPAEAVTVLTAALRLWRGQPLTELSGVAACAGSVARLEALRLNALADRIDAEGALGRHAALVPELEDLVRSHPLDERLIGQLMTALYRCGRQADALSAYRAAAARLAEELGVDPSPTLRHLHGRLLRQEEPTPPTDRITVSAGPVPPPRRSLPVPRTPLVGRREELALAVDLVRRDDVRLVTVVGAGGTGKTRLALEAARVLNTDPVRVVIASLAGVDDEAELLPEICRALDAGPDWAGEALIDVARRALAGRRTVLVLDNLEQLADSGVHVVDELLDAVPWLTVLATSRTSLHLRGEHLLPLSPLPVPGPIQSGAPSEADVEAMLDCDAVRLFRDRAVAALPDFAITPANAVAVAEVCRMLDGLPLALELAAARVRVLPPEEMLRRVGNRLQLLAGGAADLPERHRSMRAALDWSVHLLDASERRMFAQLSVFAGGWSLEAAEEVCTDTAAGKGATATSDDFVEILGRLVDRSLVVAAGSGRFHLLGTVRDYAVELLERDAAAYGAELIRDRHAEHYTRLAEHLAAGLRRRWESEARDRLGLDAANVSAAMEYAARRRDSARLARLVTSMLDYWFRSGRIERADHWVGVARSSDLPPDTAARLLFSAGNLALVEGDLGRAEPALAGAYRAAVALGDAGLTSRALAARAVTARYAGRTAAALELVNAALSVASGGGERALWAHLGNERGELLDELGHGGQALRLLEEFRAWAALEGGPSTLAVALANLALYAVEANAAERGRHLMDEARHAAEVGGSPPLQADVLATVGLAELRLGRPRDAVTALWESVELMHAAGQLLTVPDTVSLLGVAMLDVGESRAAARLLAAGETWRAARGQALVGRLVRLVVADAKQRLPSALKAEELVAEQAEGAMAPYGSLAALRPLWRVETADLRDVDVSSRAVRSPR